MNRRGFMSLLTGTAGAALVPWRGNVEPLIFVPPRKAMDLSKYLTSNTDWFLKTDPAHDLKTFYRTADLTEEPLEEMLVSMRNVVDERGIRIALKPTKLIVSPNVKRLIDTDPVVRHAAELALGRKL